VRHTDQRSVIRNEDDVGGRAKVKTCEEVDQRCGYADMKVGWL